MSYDLFFFQLKEGVTADEINNYLDSEEHLAYAESRGNDDPLIPAKYIDSDLSEKQLRGLLGKAYLRATVPEDERSERLIRYLESDATEPAEDDEDLEEWQDDLEMTFEYSAVGGMVPIMFSYGGDLRDALGLAVDMLYELEGRRIAVFDPQINKVLDAQYLEDSTEEDDQGFDEDEHNDEE